MVVRDESKQMQKKNELGIDERQMLSYIYVIKDITKLL